MPRFTLPVGILLALLLGSTAPAPVRAQTKVAIEALGGGGFTLVDVQQASGQSGRVRNDETGMYGYLARVLFTPAGGGRASFGVEVGYQYLYYYEVPYGTTTLYRDIDAKRFSGVVRAALSGGFVLEVGAGVHSFDGGSSLSGFEAVGIDVSLGSGVSIPIRVRVDQVFDDVMTVPVGGMAGLRIEL